MNAVNRTGIDRFLYGIFPVAILVENSRSTVFCLDIEGVASDVGAVFTADAGQFVNVYPFLAQDSP